MQYRSVVLQDLSSCGANAAYYRLGEASGLSAFDQSQNDYTGAIAASGIAYSQAGAIKADPNTALKFDGLTGKVTAPAGLNPGGWTSISIEFWMNLSTLSQPSSPAITANALVGASNTGFVIFINTTATALNFLLGNGASNTQCSAGFAFSTNTYFHIVATWDGTTMNIYVNGVRKGGPTAFTGPIAASANQVTIGHNPAGSDFFIGTLDETVYYGNKALTQDQITRHFQAGPQQYGRISKIKVV